MSHQLQIIFALCLIAFVKAEVYLSADGEESYGNKIDDLLKILETDVVKATVNAKEDLDKATDFLVIAANKYETDANAQMAADEKKWLADVASCLGSYETKLRQEQEVYNASMVKCANEDIANGTRLIQGALDHIKDLASEVDHDKNLVKECEKQENSAGCFARVSIAIQEDIVGIPQKIQLTATETSIALNDLQPELKTCASDAASSFESASQKLVHTIATCLSSKISV